MLASTKGFLEAKSFKPAETPSTKPTSVWTPKVMLAGSGGRDVEEKDRTILIPETERTAITLMGMMGID